MSTEAHVDQARRWLEEQLVALAGLRNAQPRDPGFRNWRQNTLTVLQRIWPGDATRSERFRRIPFSMPGSRANPRAMREWYSRGCSEAAKVLRELLEEVDTVGVPAMDAAPEPRGLNPGEAEDDFPMRDLPASDAVPAVRPADEDDDHMLDLGGPGGPIGVPTASMLDRAPDEPLPPSLPVRAKVVRAAEAPAASEPRPAALRSRPGAPPAAAASGRKRVAAKPPRKERSRPPARQRLKDMLGFDRFEAELGSALDVPAAAPSEPAAASAPEASAPPPTAAPDAPGSGSVDTSPPRRRSGAKVDPSSLIAAEFRDAPAVEHRRTAATPAAPAETRAAPAPPAPSAAAPAAPVSGEDVRGEDAEGLDPEAFAAATEAFFLTSPVLGSTGRPVQRVSDGTSFMDPDAVGVATLAADIGRLSVPEPQRASLRAHLLDLARQLESGGMEWASLRQSVITVMEHPEVARRLMPILLPWLDRAA